MTEYDVRGLVEPYWDKLAAFSTAAEIRKFLGAEEITGQCDNWTRCAVAEYLYRGIGHRVEVRPASLVLRRGAHLSEFIFHSQAMQEFIVGFDEGDYPELEVSSYPALEAVHS